MSLRIVQKNRVVSNDSVSVGIVVTKMIRFELILYRYNGEKISEKTKMPKSYIDKMSLL